MDNQKKAQKKRQHYVPQFYLRNFSKDEHYIYIYNLKSGKIEEGPISRTCEKKYFYGKDDEFENILERIETDHSKIIHNILKQNIPPIQNSVDHF